MNRPRPPQFHAAPDEPVYFLLSRDKVEALDIEAPLGALRTMAATADTARAFAGRVHIVFDGYNDDPREVYQVPAVRSFVMKLTEQFPHWFHFMNKVDDSLLVILKCLTKPQPVVISDGRVATSVDIDEFNRVALGLFTRMNALYADLGLTERENAETTDQVAEYFRAIMQSPED